MRDWYRVTVCCWSYYKVVTQTADDTGYSEMIVLQTLILLLTAPCGIFSSSSPLGQWKITGTKPIKIRNGYHYKTIISTMLTGAIVKVYKRRTLQFRLDFFQTWEKDCWVLLSASANQQEWIFFFIFLQKRLFSFVLLGTKPMGNLVNNRWSVTLLL